MRHRYSSRVRPIWLAIPLTAMFVLTSVERPAQAITPAAVVAAIGYVRQVYNTLMEVRTFFEGDGPTMAQLLSNVEANILNELRTQRNQAWKATAQTAFDQFRTLAARSAGHPNNAALRDEASMNAIIAIEQLSIIVQEGTDVESSYQLAPTFDALVATQSGLTWALDEIFPGTRAPWAEYHVYLWRGINTDYRLIGSQFFQCWPGFNPGRGNYTVGLPTEPSRSYRDSQLWTKKIANRSINLGSQGYFPPLLNGQCVASSAQKVCNPGKKNCQTINGCPTLPAQSCNPFHGCAAPVCGFNMACPTAFPVASWILQASQNVDPTWNADPVVKIIRASMTSIMSLGGGEDPASDSDTNLPYQGLLVDPWVYEPRCGSNNPWAYPTLP